MSFIYVHGAGASPRSFAWIDGRLALPGGFRRARHMIEYTTDHSVEQVAERVRSVVRSQTKPITLIGHSLGGLIVALAADEPGVERVITLAAPFGGSTLASVMRWVSDSPLFRDLTQTGTVLRAIHGRPLPCPFLSFVATSGLPTIPTDNDGVLTVASQTALQGPEYVHVPVNHFEILLDVDVVERIRDFMTPPMVG